MFFENEITYVFTCPLEILLRPWASPSQQTVRINPNDAAPYAQMIRDEIFKSLEKSGCLHDLLGSLTGMIAHKNELLLPSVTRWDGEFIGICSLICREEKLYSDILEVAEYLRDQYRSGWGADFSKRGISTPLGQLFVNFCGNDPDKLDIHQCC